MFGKNHRWKAIAIAKQLLFFLLCTETISYSQNASNDSIKVQLDTLEILREQPGMSEANKVYSTLDIQTTPGSLGDPMRVLASSAEVVSSADMQAIPIIAGDEADGILTLLDGFPIAFPYRLLGGFSLFNPLTTSRLDLRSTGFPVLYGGYAPTTIDVKSNLAYDAHPSIYTDMSLPISSALIHFPLSDSLRCSASIAFRASHVRVAVALLSGSDRDRLESFLPELKDVQFFVNEMPSMNLYMFQEGLISTERGSLNSLDRTFDYSWQKGFAGAAFLTSSDMLSSEHRVSCIRDNVSLSTALSTEYIALDCQFTMFRLRDQFQFAIYPGLAATIGSEVLYGNTDIQINSFSSWLNKKSPLHSKFVDASLFSEIQWSLTDHIAGTIGVRGTYFGFVELPGIEPRGVIDFNINDRSKIKFSVGQYLQAPSDFQMLHGFLTFLAMPNQTPRMMIMSGSRKSLNLQNTTLFALDASTQLIANPWIVFDVQLNGYHKQTESLILPGRYPSVFTPLDTMSFEPLQKFRAKKSGAGISSIIGFLPLDLTLTLSVFVHKSRVIDTRSEQEYRTAGDIPLTSKLFLRFEPSTWIVGVLYQYSVGMPTTEEYNLKASNLLGETIFIPVWRKLNSARLSNYHRLDVNITKTWKGPRWTVALSLGVLNVLSNQNVSDYRYEFSESDADFVKKTPVTNTLPFLPQASLRCEYTW